MSFRPASLASSWRCMFCECPGTEDGVPVDVDKLSKWSEARTGVPIAIEPDTKLWSCMNCVREAKIRIWDLVPMKEDYIWWPQLKDPYFKYYLKGWLKSCSVPIQKLHNEEIENNMEAEETVEKVDTAVLSPPQGVLYLLPSKTEFKVEPFSAVNGKIPIAPAHNKYIPKPLSKQKVKPRDQKCAHCHTSINKNRTHPSPRQCQTCDKTLPCLGLWKIHRQDCHVSCPECLAIYDDYEELDAHRNSAHPSIPGYVWNRNTLMPEPCKCSFCPVRFVDKAVCQKHESRCRFNPDILHPQTSSNESKNVEKSSKKPMLAAATTVNFSCHICKTAQRFSKEEISDHLDKKHPLEKCSQCGQLLQRNYVEQHMLLKHNIVVQVAKCNFLCPLCNFSASTKHEVRSHLRMHNIIVRAGQCTLCNKMFRDGPSTLNHYCPTKPTIQCKFCNCSMYQEYVPEHQIAEKCDICQETYSCQTLFKRHTKGRTFTCSYCKQDFCQKSSLVSHASTEHQKVIEVAWEGMDFYCCGHECHDCCIYFSSAILLLEHTVKYHIGVHCKLCAKWMNKLVHLRTHLRAFHLCSESQPYFQKLMEIDQPVEISVPSVDAEMQKFFTCPLCSKKAHFEKIVEHVKVVHQLSNNVRKTYLAFIEKGVCKYHNEIKITDSNLPHREFVCGYCSKDFHLQNKVEEHIASMHISKQAY